MNIFFKDLLKSFHYESWSDLAYSLVPSQKYNLTWFWSLSSALLVSADKAAGIIFGLDGLAFIALFFILITELGSGILASRIRKERFQSSKLRRFGFRLFYYFILIGTTYLLAESYRVRGKNIPYWAFDWLHEFIVIQIVFENITSILENIAVIDGKNKTRFIQKIKSKLESILS